MHISDAIAQLIVEALACGYVLGCAGIAAFFERRSHTRQRVRRRLHIE